MSVRLWPTLPKDHEDNGFAALERPLLEDPAGPYYIVAEVNRRRATIDDDDDATTPTIRVLHGEALLGDLSKIARDLLREAKEKRCGKPRPAPEPQPPMFDGNGHDLGDDPDGDNSGEMPGGGDPVQRHLDRAAALAGDMEPEFDGDGESPEEDDGDETGAGETPSDLDETGHDASRVPFLSAAGDE